MSDDRTYLSELIEVIEKTPAPPPDPASFVRGALHYSFTEFHRRWWDFVDGNPFALVLAPRGHGKSTVLTVAYCLFRILDNQDLRVLLCSRAAAQAEALLREIKKHLETNPDLLGRYIGLKGAPWTESEICLQARMTAAKEATVTALGVMGPVISRHYDLIVLDDVVDEENASSRTRREKLLTWYYKQLLPTLEPGGGLKILGTRYHRDDLYGRLITSGFPHLAEPAIIGEGENQRALWEEKFPLALLKKMREEAGPAIFNTQYQNDVRAAAAAVFRPEWIRRAASPPALRKYQGVDLAVGQDDHHDYFAIVTVGETGPGAWSVIDVYRARLSFEQQFRAIAACFGQHDRPGSPVIRVGVEANAYQQVMIQRLRAETRLPVIAVNQTRDKITRALSLQALFETGRITFSDPFPPGRKQDFTALLDELLSFPGSDHDDAIDALEIAIRLAREATRFLDLPNHGLDVQPD